MPKYQVQVYNCYSLHVRAAGRVSSKVIQWVQKGEKYTSSKQASNGWMYLDEKKGWSNGKYLKKLKRLDTDKKPTSTKPKADPKPPAETKPPDVDKIARDSMNAFKTSTTKGATFNNTAAVGLAESDYNFKGTQVTKATRRNRPTGYNPDLGLEVPVAHTDQEVKEAAAAEASSGVPVGAQKMSLLSTTTTFNPAAMQRGLASLNSVERSSGQQQAQQQKPPAVHDYTIDTSYLDKQLEVIRRNLNIRPARGYDSMYSDLSVDFNRFKINFPSYFLNKTFGHVFFTRPDMQFFLNDGSALRPAIESDTVFKGIHMMNPKLLKSLTRHYRKAHGFQPFLSNTAASFEIPDEFIKTMEHGETMVGHKMQYGRNNIEANNAGTFNINYTDDAHLSIYQIHKAWIDYISKVSRGEIDLAYTPYRANKVLDYTCSVYFILCGPDNETILFWTKYFGVFPTTAPSSAASWTKGSPVRNPDVNIQYSYSMKEDLNLLSLAEFNVLSNTTGETKYNPTYAAAKDAKGDLIGLGEVGRTMVGAPFIEKILRTDGGADYKLRFRHRK